MKNIILSFFALSLFISCNQAQNTDNTEKKDSIKCEAEIFGTDTIKGNSIVLDSTKKGLVTYEETVFTYFEVDTIPDFTATNPRKSSFIKKRLELLVGKPMKAKCESIGVNYPPQFVLHRAFKHEGEYEIWVGNSRSDSLKLLAILPICAVDNEPGPKLERGDGKTPEGFYRSTILYGSTMDFMWMNLNEGKLDEFGEVGGKCSSFKICLDYPIAVDRRRTQKLMPSGTSPGSAICVHANCVTAGCISFENRNYLPVFLSQLHHKSANYGKVLVHIYPYRFDKQNMDFMAENAYSQMPIKDTKAFWKELEKGYILFESTHKALKVSNKGEKYNFSTYQ